MAGSCKRVTETYSVVTGGFFLVVLRMLASIKMLNNYVIFPSPDMEVFPFIAMNCPKTFVGILEFGVTLAR